MDDDSIKVSTIRETIEELTRLAGHLQDGLNTRVEFGICDGDGLQMIGDFDVSYWTHMQMGEAPGPQFVLFRGHLHPGSVSSPRHRNAAADVDDELRKLTDEDAG